MAKFKTIKAILLTLVLITLYYLYDSNTVRDLGYLTRPVWDRRKPKQWNIIPHFYTDGRNVSQMCELHKWKGRTNKVKVIDAIIFSVEFDLLEIRIKELWPFVDHFIVLEADKTFTGRQKPLFLNENLDRFSWAQQKLRYHSYKGLEALKPGESPFHNEIQMRIHMSSIIRRFAKEGDIIISSDLDEIPSAQTIQLIRECEGFPNDMHLQFRPYFYSFEFLYGTDLIAIDSWSARVSIYNQLFYYRHGRVSDNLLADSGEYNYCFTNFNSKVCPFLIKGWHCSFCFRYLSDFIFKMTSYSHNDRVTKQRLLDKSEIQRKICNGDDVYDMYPEVYTFKEMIIKFGSIPKTKAMTNLPKHLVNNPKKFAFLLPDGCIREDFNKRFSHQNS